MRWRAAALVALAGVALTTTPVTAHPLGNFSISHYAAIVVGEGGIEVRYILDLAEIPTFQELQQHGIVADATAPTALAYADRKTAELTGGLRLEANREALPLERQAVEILFPPGAGGLPTLKVGARYRYVDNCAAVWSACCIPRIRSRQGILFRNLCMDLGAIQEKMCSQSATRIVAFVARWNGESSKSTSSTQDAAVGTSGGR